MRSDEIRNLPEEGISLIGWLKEIAYQVALGNESREPFEPLPPFPGSGKGKRK